MAVKKVQNVFISVYEDKFVTKMIQNVSMKGL